MYFPKYTNQSVGQFWQEPFRAFPQASVVRTLVPSRGMILRMQRVLYAISVHLEHQAGQRINNVPLTIIPPPETLHLRNFRPRKPLRVTSVTSRPYRPVGTIPTNAHNEKTSFQRFLSDPPLSFFKKLIVSTPRLLRQRGMDYILSKECLWTGFKGQTKGYYEKVKQGTNYQCLWNYPYDVSRA